MTDLKVCRICLRTEARVFNYDTYQLKCYYEEVMALKVFDNDNLPHYFCYECATMLHKFHKFKEKCYSGQKALKELLWRGPISYEQIYRVDRAKYNLESNLDIMILPFLVDTSPDNNTEERMVEVGTEVWEENDGSMSSGPNDATEVATMTEEIDENNEMNDQVNIQPPAMYIEIKTESGDERKESTEIKGRKALDESNWKKWTLTEEEAVEEMRKKARDSKYLAAEFKCTDCFRWFSKSDMLKRHILRRHRESLGDHECHLCHMRFGLPCYLSRHMRDHYYRYQCLRCDRICHLENSALVHDQFHSGVIKKCIHCNEEFLLSSTYYTHLRTHRSEHVCALCGASFVSQAGLHMHKRLKHVIDDVESPDDDEEVNTYCDRCQIRFETRKAYEEHLFHSAMHTQKEYEDVVSSNVGAQRKVLGKREKAKITRALRKDRPDESVNGPFGRKMKRARRKKMKPTTCHQCGKHFATQAACLRHHVAEHPRTSFYPPTERHICEICGASLAPGSVSVHQNMHTKEKVHTCNICGRHFYASISLKRHLLTHTGEKPFACKLCDKRFTQSNSMKLHYRTFHLKQPYPKRTRRKKDDTQEFPEDSGSSSEESDSVQETDMNADNGIEPAPTMDTSDDTVHYLTLS